MIGYHGTSAGTASSLQAGAVDVTSGGGELGQGFYTGEHLWVAKAWAVGRYDDRQKNVVAFEVPDTEVDLLHIEMRDGHTATLMRSDIRRNKQTRTYTFGCDMVWSPIVGKETITCDQHKWESLQSQTLLNGAKVTRNVV
jgi:hypothetical protein